jgi:hypothetical protein
MMRPSRQAIPRRRSKSTTARAMQRVAPICRMRRSLSRTDLLRRMTSPPALLVIDRATPRRERPTGSAWLSCVTRVRWPIFSAVLVSSAMLGVHRPRAASDRARARLVCGPGDVGWGARLRCDLLRRVISLLALAIYRSSRTALRALGRAAPGPGDDLRRAHAPADPFRRVASSLALRSLATMGRARSRADFWSAALASPIIDRAVPRGAST